MKSCEKVVIAKGKSLVEWVPTQENKDEILKLAMGRSGNLRAPSVMVGKTLIIGFNDTLYDRYLKSR